MSTVSKPYTNLAIYAVLGIPLLAQYSTIYSLSNTDYNNLWSNNGRNIISKYSLTEVYQLMMLLSTISGLYLLYYFLEKIQYKKIFGYSYYDTDIVDGSRDSTATKGGGRYFIEVGLLMLVGFSLLWLPSFYNGNRGVTSMVLFGVAIGSTILLAALSSINIDNTEDIVAITCAVIMFIQHMILDYGLWS